MQKLPRLSGKETIKILSKFGFYPVKWNNLNNYLNYYIIGDKP